MLSSRVTEKKDTNCLEELRVGGEKTYTTVTLSYIVGTIIEIMRNEQKKPKVRRIERPELSFP